MLGIMARARLFFTSRVCPIDSYHVYHAATIKSVRSRIVRPYIAILAMDEESMFLIALARP